MSYIVTRTNVRSNIETGWHTMSPFHTSEYTSWLGQNWISNGKISMEFIVSEDQLTMTVNITCLDEATWNDLTSQQQHIDYQALKTAWNNQHGITQTTTFATV